MQIVITKNKGLRQEFVYNYLPLYIEEVILQSCDKRRLQVLDKNLNINSYEILKFAFDHLYISETPSEYILKIDKNLRWNNLNVSSLISLITYGNRQVKGYPIVRRVFETIVDNIDVLYSKWEEGSKWL